MAGGCHMIGGTTDLYIDPALEAVTASSSTGGSTNVGSTGGGQGAGSQGGGGAGPMVCVENTGEPPTMWTCPEPVTDCRTCKFIEGECVMDNLDTGTMCTENDGTKCDGGGNCVQCTKNEDCPSNNCQDNVCYDATCDDLVINGNETDLNCGGEDCAPCENGETCKAGSDCKSTLCKSLKCAPCNAEEQDDCATGQYCEKSSNHCTPTKSGGQACGDDYECQTGTCCEVDWQDYCKGFFPCL